MIESQKNHSYTRLRGGQAHFNDYQKKSAFVLFIQHSTEAIVLWMDVSEDKVISQSDMMYYPATARLSQRTACH